MPAPISTPKPPPIIHPYGDNAIEVKNLSFAYNSHSTLSAVDPKYVLNGLNLNLATGSRCLLIGANGSGKSTLMRILAGRSLTPEPVKVLGLNAFRDTKLNFHRAYLDCDWGMTSVSLSWLTHHHPMKVCQYLLTFFIPLL